MPGGWLHRLCRQAGGHEAARGCIVQVCGASEEEDVASLSRFCVVDDHPENRSALRAILSSPDYRIVEAASGAEALLRLLQRTSRFFSSMSLCRTWCASIWQRLLKERERTATVPIVFLTAEATDADLVHQRASRGGDYLITPLAPDMVRAKVAVFAQLFQEKQRNEQQAALLLEAQRNESDFRLIDLRLANERRYRTLAERFPTSSGPLARTVPWTTSINAGSNTRVW